MTPGDTGVPGAAAGHRDAGNDSAPRTTGLKVVRGTPDDEELAALVAGVTAIVSAAEVDDDEPGSPTSAWMDRLRTMRGQRNGAPLGRGPNSWRHSLR